MIKRNGLLLRIDTCRSHSQGVLEAGVGINYSGIGEADICVHMWVEEDQEVNPYSGKSSRERERESTDIWPRNWSLGKMISMALTSNHLKLLI